MVGGTVRNRQRYGVNKHIFHVHSDPLYRPTVPRKAKVYTTRHGSQMDAIWKLVSMLINRQTAMKVFVFSFSDLFTERQPPRNQSDVF